MSSGCLCPGATHPHGAGLLSSAGGTPVSVPVPCPLSLPWFSWAPARRGLRGLLALCLSPIFLCLCPLHLSLSFCLSLSLTLYLPHLCLSLSRCGTHCLRPPPPHGQYLHRRCVVRSPADLSSLLSLWKKQINYAAEQNLPAPRIEF